jgi:glycosyltransferase involved in cell wall biosynthesis
LRIAVIVNGLTTSIGAYHYLALLLNALQKIDDVHIDLFIPHYNDKVSYIRSFNINIVFKNNFKYYNFKKNKNPVILLKNIVKYFLNKYIAFNEIIFMNYVKKRYGLLFYPWPYDITPISCPLPIFFVPHDFTISHFFGMANSIQVWERYIYEEYKNNLLWFFEHGHAIVSSNFIKMDLLSHFPKVNMDIVPLSALNNYEFMPREEIDKILNKYNISNNYIVWASNGMLHKNLNQMIGAYYYIKQKHHKLKLIITGSGIGEIRLRSTSHYYADQLINDDDEWDIASFGIMPENDFSCLLQGAKVVVNTSLCEAGNGSGLDAWSLGIPVAQSDIPAFNEQINYLGVKPEIFDPKNDRSIADAVLRILDNPEQAAENAAVSKKAIENYTWDDIAMKYYTIFIREMKELSKTK